MEAVRYLVEVVPGGRSTVKLATELSTQNGARGIATDSVDVRSARDIGAVPGR